MELIANDVNERDLCLFEEGRWGGSVYAMNEVSSIVGTYAKL